jgi:hypothetical protein
MSMSWPMRFGKIDEQKNVMEALLRRGEHIHRHISPGQDVMCEGGDSECPLWAMQLEEAMESWQG